MEATAIKERPILFSGPMVCAILDGRKTQTRRLLKLPKCMEWYQELGGEAKGWFCEVRGAGWWHVEELVCPYGDAGYHLWVRETWRRIETGMNSGKADYRADDPSASGLGFMPWRPSIFMRRADSRITLEITDVRTERLQEITEEDAQAEGVQMGYQPYSVEGRTPPTPVGYRPVFKRLWDSINGDDSWDANPWVWAISFRVVEPTNA